MAGPAKDEEREEVPAPTLRRMINDNFDDIVASLRSEGLGEDIIAEVEGMRQRALELVEG